eukprot:SAG11_NODE_851_length_6875_cov_8.193034_7_plen_88_part_00
MDELESDFGVLAYMNTRANASEIVEKFVLKKCVDKWNIRCETPLPFSMLAPSHLVPCTSGVAADLSRPISALIGGETLLLRDFRHFR